MPNIATIAPGWLALSPSGDPSGVTDSVNYATAIAGFPRHRVTLTPGAFSIASPMLAGNNTVTEGSGVEATVIQQGTSFSGSSMWQAALSASLKDLALKGLGSAGPAADAISVTQQNGGYLASVGLQNVAFSGVNGWCVNFTDTGASGAPTGCEFDGLFDWGGNKGGVALFGHLRTLGTTIKRLNMNGSGDQSTNGLDGLLVQDAYDIEVDDFFLGASQGGSALHLKGHVANARFVHSETGGGLNNLLIEDGPNGHVSGIDFSHVTWQTPAAELVSLNGNCTDITFDDCRFNASPVSGVKVSTAGSRIKFHGCSFGVTPAGNGTGAAGTNYDLNWLAGGGEVVDCEFASNAVPAGQPGVQFSVNLPAGSKVPFDGITFSGANSNPAANWFTNEPVYLRVIGGSFIG